jgi:PAS domain S-box-containing protein
MSDIHEPSRTRVVSAWIVLGVVLTVWGFVLLRGQRIAGDAQQQYDQGAILSQAISQSNAAMIEADLSGTITGWSAGARRLLGWDDFEALGKPIDILIPDRFQSRHHAAFTDTTKAERTRVQQLTCVAVTSSGAEIPVVLLVWTLPNKVITVATPRDQFMSIDTADDH